MSLLSERVMLASLRIGSWSGTLFDGEVTEEVSERHHAEQGAGRYNKQIVARKFLHPVTSKISAARTAHRVLTLPWLDDGPRALYCPTYTQYAQSMRLAKQGVQAAAAEVAAKLPEALHEAKNRLGSMFNQEDYPTAEEIKAKYYVEAEISPMPEAQDFRAKLSDDAVKAITKDIERRTSERLEKAVGDVYKRVGTVVAKMSERLKAYEPGQGEDEKAKHTFRDSLIYNIKEVADLIPHLNITADPALDALGQQLIADLVAHSPEELKTNDKLRAATAAKADKIFNKVKKFMA